MLEKIIRSKIPQEQLRERERESQTQMWNTHKKDETQIERLMQGFTIEIFWNCLLKQDGDFHWSWCLRDSLSKISFQAENKILLQLIHGVLSHLQFYLRDWGWGLLTCVLRCFIENGPILLIYWFKIVLHLVVQEWKNGSF